MTKAHYQWSIPRQTIEIDKQIIKNLIFPAIRKSISF